jgi:hypothetical protein
MNMSMSLLSSPARRWSSLLFLLVMSFTGVSVATIATPIATSGAGLSEPAVTARTLGERNLIALTERAIERQLPLGAQANKVNKANTTANAEQPQLNIDWSPVNSEQYVAQRVSCAIALSRLQWSYNLWPADNGVKPDFSTVADLDKLQQQTELSIKKERLLSAFFGVELTKQQLQAELDRMARSTRNSQRLQHLFTLLGNDAKTVIECVARPNLVNQHLTAQYQQSDKIHADVKAQAESELASYLQSDLQNTSTAGAQLRHGQISTVDYTLNSSTDAASNQALTGIESGVNEVNGKVGRAPIALSASDFRAKTSPEQLNRLVQQSTAFVYAQRLNGSLDDLAKAQKTTPETTPETIQKTTPESAQITYLVWQKNTVKYLGSGAGRNRYYY